MRLEELIRRQALRHPGREALSEEGRRITYGQLWEEVLAAAAFLEKHGVRKGDRVAIFSKNSIAATAACFGVFAAGGVAVWLDPVLDEKSLARIVADAAPAVIFFDSVFRKKLPPAPKSWDLAEAFAERGAAVLSEKQDTDLAALVYTSGSTADPLGVMLTHLNLSSNALAVAECLELTPEDRAGCVLPFHYIYGFSVLLSHLAAGASVVLENRFAFPSTTLDSFQKEKITGFYGVSSHYILLLQETDFASRSWPSLRYWAQAGDKMPRKITEKLLELFPRKKIYLMYGQTEASPRLTCLDPSKTARKPESAGQPLPGVEISVLDSSGRECAAGESGEICARGKGVMKGYWNKPQETAEILEGGRLHTGDLGFRDAEGDLWITGRMKNFVKIGGQRIGLAEIEVFAYEHPDVTEAVAAEVRDAILGQRLRLYVSVRGGLKEEDLRRHFARRLPPYKVPAEIIFLDTIPKGSGGKPDRAALAKKFPDKE